jgi:hypothetical protein
VSALDPLRAARARLHRDGGGAERVIHTIDRALRTWQDPDSPWRDRLAREQKLYSRPVLDHGIVRGLEHWSGDVMRALRDRELPRVCRTPEVTAVWLAGSIPTSAFSAILLPLLAGSSVYVKPSSEDPHSPALFAESIGSIDQAVGDLVVIGTDRAALEEADAVVAHGRDETIEALRQKVLPERPFVAHGHKLSIAAVGHEIDAERAAERVALDLALYDGRGCLSPAYVLAEARPSVRPDVFSEALAGAMERVGTDLPRGALSPAENAWVRDTRARMTVRRNSRLWTSQVGGTASTDWTIALEGSDEIPPPGMLRTVSVIPTRDVGALRDWCGGLAPHLSSIGHCGWGDRTPFLREAALCAGGSRICPSGRMQLPPLDWRHDGIGPLAPLVRSLDVEDEKGRGS